MMAGRTTRGSLLGAYVLRGPAPRCRHADASSEVNKVPVYQLRTDAPLIRGHGTTGAMSVAGN